jgi:hypothetical protein
LESILGLHKRLKIRALASQAGGINSLESILGLLKSLKIRALSTLSVSNFPHTVAVSPNNLNTEHLVCLLGPSHPACLLAPEHPVILL